MINKSKQKGFTLIELLVVISIIGLLSSVVLATLNTTRIKARDARRIAALKEIQKAIELYASDHDGDYPGYVAPSSRLGLETEEYTFMRSGVSSGEIGDNKYGYGDTGTPGASNDTYKPGIWRKMQVALAPYLKDLPNTDIINNNYYYFLYKVPSKSALYNPTGLKTYGLSVKLESTTNPVGVNDGGYFNGSAGDNRFELGSSPTYCKSKYGNTVYADWSPWDPYPCWGDNPASLYVP